MKAVIELLRCLECSCSNVSATLLEVAKGDTAEMKRRLEWWEGIWSKTITHHSAAAMEELRQAVIEAEERDLWAAERADEESERAAMEHAASMKDVPF